VGEYINGISEVYYTQIVNLVDRQTGGDEDQWNTEQTLGRRIMKEQAMKKLNHFYP
jgi:hypothetical protein